ncbi:hypothetical protein BHAOGJBA_4995 [Methylobacterium hispanicum]|uniref:Uncharacterized protein n=1 Tax=Methylobacterium hispanicum TaxID=270350 RepID=A0AAV4ZSJ5_9HYPH|nr:MULTISPECIES: hypothetical protein [Methylobacterium]GJD91447.1 hypothetical protein BHAOGJBA_4995 [Methylobacterium hispanicum]
MVSSPGLTGFNVSAYAALQAGPAPSSLATDVFARWTAQAQADYVQANGSGTPRAVLIGPDQGRQAVAVLAAAGNAVTLTPTDTAPTDLAAATFGDWPAAVKLDYVEARGVGAPPVVLIGPPDGARILASPDAAGTGVATDTAPADIEKPAAALTADGFGNWPAAAKRHYVLTRGIGDPPAVLVGPADTTRRVATLDAKAQTVGLTKLPDAFGTGPAALAADTFRAWPEAVQVAYVLANGTGEPPKVALQTPGAIATITRFGGGMTGAMLMLANPTPNIYGSDKDLSGAPNADNAELLFPTLNGTPGKTLDDKPSNFTKLPDQLTPKEFGAWHTAIQIEYVRKNLQPSQNGGKAVTIGTSASETVTAFVAAGGTKLYTVDTLQKADIARMPLADQTTLAGLDIFANATTGLRIKLNLTVSKTEVTDLVNAAITNINAMVPGGTPQVFKGNDFMSAANRKIFTDELGLLNQKIASGAIFSKGEITDQIKLITDRFERANCFAKIAETDGRIDRNNTGVRVVLDTEDNGSIRRSYTVFMEQEARLLQIAQSRQSLAGTGKIEGTTQNLDVPNLIYLFQLYANQAGEANIRIQTEEINQVNEVLKMYNIVQSLVSETIKSIAPEKDGKTNNDATDLKYDGDATRQKIQKAAVAVFQNGWGHPVEVLHNIVRGADNVNGKSSSQWSTYANQLSERVTLLNQESQILMNKVNSDTKAKDRNFDLANNALSKMNEIVQKIAGTS